MAETKETKKPARDVDGKLTYDGMVETIKSGGSVQLPGQPPITSIDDLPSAAELAKGDAAQEKQVLAALDAQAAAIQAQRQMLLGGSISSGSGNASQSANSGNQSNFQTDLVAVVGAEEAAALGKAGFNSPDSLRAATDADLDKVKGLGAAKIAALRAKYGSPS